MFYPSIYDCYRIQTKVILENRRAHERDGGGDITTHLCILAHQLEVGRAGPAKL